MTDVAGLPFAVEQQAPDIGKATPLTAAYCAERAAFAIVRAETAPLEPHRQYLACATAWRKLGEAMATQIPMNRPRDPDRDREPRR